MSFFNLIQKKGSKPIPPAPNSIRKEIVHSSSNAKKTSFLNFHRPNSAPPVSKGLGQRVTKDRNRPTATDHVRKRKKSQHTRLLSDSDSAESETPAETPRKRSKLVNGARKPMKRKLRSVAAFSEDDHGLFPMVHASDIAALDKPTKYRCAFPQQETQQGVQLQYPSASQQETFNLVEPLQKDDFKPLEDIIETLEMVMNYYLPPADAVELKDDSHGLLRRLKRAKDKKDGAAFMSLVQEWNHAITEARIDGRIARVLDESTELDLKLIERILTQTYARTVSPRVSSLRQYENGTDNVYGELLPKFVSEIFRITELGSNHVFVDLGSGVGNVVLQAALEVGCESWGCEIMENACVLAKLQEQEFTARCRLWGLAVGDINLERGDFLENQKIINVLPKADVILVNNQAFTPELNDRLTSHFLDLKEGCQVVSLKSFVPAGHRITSRTLNSAYNVLEVDEKRYYSACVSWTDAPGTYYVSRKDSSRLRAFTTNGVAV
ncbi:Nucleosomal histone H3-Lys79 methylase [Xanthoria parietina]